MLRLADQPSKNIPLKQVNIVSKIYAFAANVTIIQLFQNEEQTSIEAVYCFPVEENAAVYSFTAKIDDREIVAQLKEKREAQYEYSNALRQGHGAYLFEQDEKSQDCFVVNVGALPPGKQCEIKISYVTELQLVNDGKTIQFVVPTAIAPRYNSLKERIFRTVVGTRSQYIQSAPYTIELNCQIDKLKQLVSHISSPSHSINVDFSNEEFYQINFVQKSTHLDRDIILDIQLSETRSNTILAVQNNVVMAVLTPNEEDCRKALETDVGGDISSTNEFIFVIDCSDSMRGGKINAARQAMLIFLKSLPVHCRFNIIQFGSCYESLFGEEGVTAIYNEKTMEKAQEMIKMMQADLGGTELLSPLQYLHSKSPLSGYSRQIFLLTDGEVSNENKVRDLCRSMSTSSRIFSFGLGHSPSRSLIKTLARTTNGFFVFIPPNTPVDIYVAQQLEKALQPCITNVQVRWNQTDIKTVPTKSPPVYANNRLIFYGLFDTSHFEHDITVSLYKTDNNVLLGQAKVNCIPTIVEDQTIDRLVAKAFINELQHAKTDEENKGSRQTRFRQQDELSTSAANGKEDDQRKQQIIDLSLKYTILSPYTSFVATEKRLKGDNSDMILREVPIEISTDDKHLFKGLQLHNQAYVSSLACNNTGDTHLAPVHHMIRNRRQLVCDMDNELSNRNTQRYTIKKDISLCEVRIEGRNKQATSRFVGDAPFNNVDRSFSTSTKWPTAEKDIIRYLIDLQKFDGLWSLSDEQIEKLTKQPYSSYGSQYTTDQQVISSVLVLITLKQKRFQPFQTLWRACVKKTERRLAQLLGGHEKLELVLQEMREQTLNDHHHKFFSLKQVLRITVITLTFFLFFVIVFSILSYH